MQSQRTSTPRKWARRKEPKRARKKKCSRHRGRHLIPQPGQRNYVLIEEQEQKEKQKKKNRRKEENVKKKEKKVYSLQKRQFGIKYVTNVNPRKSKNVKKTLNYVRNKIRR